MQSRDNMTVLSRKERRRELRGRVDNVKDWFDNRGVCSYSDQVKMHYPDFKNFTRLANVLAGRTADESIVEMLENIIKKYEDE